MKKYLALVLSMVFVLGFAASAFAIHATIPSETTAVVAPKGTEVRLGGEIRIRGWHVDSTATNAGVRSDTGYPYKPTEGSTAASWYDQRVRLLLDIKTAPNVTGRIHLETDPENWNWGTTGGTSTQFDSTVGAAGRGGSKRGGSTTGNTLAILEAWIAYTGKGLLGVPSGIKLGHQPIVVGEGTFFDHRRYGDDAIVLWIEPAKGTEINLVTAKLSESTTTLNTNDIDLYTLILSHKLDKDHTVGANYSIIKSDGIATAGDVLVYRGIANVAGDSINIQNLGLLAKGKIAGLGYKATADFQFGETKTGAGVKREKYSGYGYTLGVDYKVDPVTVRANYVYGSGDTITTDDKNKAFQTFVGNVIDPNLPTVVYGWRINTAATGAVRGTGISNTTAYNLGLTFSPIKDLTAHLDYYLLRASKALRTTQGTAAGEVGFSKKIGSEVDLKLSYRLARNLTYSSNSGILFAGDFYKANTTGVTSNPKDAVVLQHQIVLSF